MAAKGRAAGLPVIGTALAVQERYKHDAADQFAAAIGFFGFLSLFPLMVLAVAVAGFVYSSPEDQARVATIITDSIPGFAATMEADGEDTGVAELVANVVDNRGAITGIGLVTLLFTGLRVVNAAMTATSRVLRAPLPMGVGGKVRQLASLAVLGVVAVAAAAASGIAGVPEGLLPRPAAVLVALAVTFSLDFVLFLAAYRLLGQQSSQVTLRHLVPGAVLAAVGWTALKVAGSAYVASQVEGANALYGAFGGIIALLLLLYLAGRLYLYGIEFAALRYERRFGPLHAGASPGPGAPAVPSAAGVPARAPAPAAAVVAGGVAVPAYAAAGRRPQVPAPDDARPNVRTAVAFGLAAAALAVGWRFLRDDD